MNATNSHGEKLSLEIRESNVVRTTSLDSSRATELTAIVGSLAHRATSPKTLRQYGYRSMLAYIAGVNCLGQYASLQKRSTNYDQLSGPTQGVWNAIPEVRNTRVFGRMWTLVSNLLKTSSMQQQWMEFVKGQTKDLPAEINSRINEFQMEGLVVPFDGSDDLQNGESGVSSVFAAAAPGTFVDYFKDWPPPEKSGLWKPEFIVVSCNPHWSRFLGDIMVNSGKELADYLTTMEKRNDDEVCNKAIEVLLTQLAAHSSNEDRPFNVGASTATAVPKGCRKKVLHGSPISGAVAAQMGKIGIDAFVSYVDPVQAGIIAAATLTTETNALFIPVYTKYQRDYRNRVSRRCVVSSVKDEIPILQSSELVNPNDLYINMTGITDSVLLNAVRYRGKSAIMTHTLSLRSYSRSKRFLRNRHDSRPETNHDRFRIVRINEPQRERQMRNNETPFSTMFEPGIDRLSIEDLFWRR